MAQQNLSVSSETLPVQAPGIILGIGLGGFFDGILLHQVLQWHHMFSDVYSVNDVPGLEMNTLGDGIFHTVTWISVLVGLGILYSRVTQQRRQVWGSRVLWGWMLVGWGLFNLIEGLIDHQILGIHHVHSGPNQLMWDMIFLASGVVLMVIGWMMARSGRPIGIAASEPMGRNG